jgi:hypothetical protein
MKNTMTVRIHHAVVLAALLGVGCEAKGDYRVSWTIDGAPVESALDCSSHGIDRIEVSMTRLSDGLQRKTVHACSAGSTGTQSAGEGTWEVTVKAFGPNGAEFIDPVTGEVALEVNIAELAVSDDGNRTEGSVDLIPNPQCSDGVDNDADGLVDALDPGCRDKNGEYLPAWDTELDEDRPGYLAVTWEINGGESCDDLQATGSATVLMVVDDTVVGLFPCADASGMVPLTSGEHEVALQLVGGADATTIAVTETQSASIVQEIESTLDFAFGLETFLEPPTGELSFRLSWIAAGQTCTDASPMVAEQSLWLQDDAGLTVEGTTLVGTSVDGTAAAVGQCIDASELQGLADYVPAGSYTLLVSGFTTDGTSCWDATFADITVGIGPNAPIELVVPQTDATGPCAP